MKQSSLKTKRLSASDLNRSKGGNIFKDIWKGLNDFGKSVEEGLDNYGKHVEKCIKNITRPHSGC